MSSFTIRAYGILIFKNRVLLTHEKHRGMEFTKFPGGGLEFGESLPQCVEREFKEEFDLDVEIDGHFFTTDEKLISAFDPNVQVISIYYRVTAHPPHEELPIRQNSIQEIKWVPLANLTPAHLTFPMDKKVVQLLLRQHQS